MFKTSTITTYIISKLARSFLSITSILVMLLWLAMSMKYIEIMATSGIELGKFIRMVSFLIIEILSLILPICALVASIVTIYSLVHDKELVVLKSSGFPDSQIIKPFIIFGCTITLLSLLISNLLGPLSKKEFFEARAELRNKYLSFLLNDGTFNNQIPGKMIYIDQRNDRKNVQGVFIYDQSNPKKSITITAESGEVTNTNKGPIFVLNNGTYQEENLEKGLVSVSTFKAYRIDLTEQDASSNNEIWYGPSTQFTNQLFHDYLFSNNPKMLAEANQRFIWPMGAIILSIIGALVALKSKYTRGANIKKSLFAGLYGGGYILLVLLVINLSQNNPIYVAVSHLLITATLFGCFFALKRY